MLTINTSNTLNKLSGFVIPCLALGGVISATTAPANASENTCQPECENEMEALPTLTKSGHKDWQKNFKKHQRQWMQNQYRWQRSQIYRPSQVNWSSNNTYIFKPQPEYNYYLRELERNQRRSRKQYECILREQQRQLRQIWGL